MKDIKEAEKYLGVFVRNKAKIDEQMEAAEFNAIENEVDRVTKNEGGLYEY